MMKNTLVVLHYMCGDGAEHTMHIMHSDELMHHICITTNMRLYA